MNQLFETDPILNRLNDTLHLLSPAKIGKGRRTMDIIQQEKPQSKDELLKIIGENNILTAGIALHAAAQAIKHPVTLEYCINHQYTLAICRAFEGEEMERKCFDEFKQYVNIKMANDTLDKVYSLDMIFKYNDIYVGIQVKPISYKFGMGHYADARERNRNNNNNFRKFIKETFDKDTLIFYVYHKKGQFVENTPEFIMEYLKENY